MRFSTLLMAGFAAVASCIPATQVVVNIKTVTTMSQKLQAPAKSIRLLDGPLLSIGQGNIPPVIRGFQEIIVTVTNAINSMNPESYNAADSDLIFDAFRTFVVVHQELLNIIIGKAGLLNTVPLVGAPVAAVLRALEAVVDALAFGLIDMMQGRKADMQQSAGALSGTITLAIGSYNGLGQ